MCIASMTDARPSRLPLGGSLYAPHAELGERRCVSLTLKPETCTARGQLWSQLSEMPAMERHRDTVTLAHQGAPAAPTPRGVALSGKDLGERSCRHSRETGSESRTEAGSETKAVPDVLDYARHGPLVLVFSRFRPDLPGGVEKVAREQVAQLRTGGWDAHPVWAYDHRALVTRVPILGDLIAAMRLAHIATRRKPVVVLINGAEYAWAFLRARNRRTSRVVVVWHGLRSHQLTQYVRTGVLPALVALPLAWANRALERRACTADHHVAITAAVAADITATLHLPPDRVELIPNGASEAARQLRQVGLLPLKYQVVWVGAEGGWRPGQKKGLDLALDACRCARARGLPISLTAIGLDRAPAWLGRRSTADPWVRWAGVMPHSRVLQEIQGADALLAPSRAENLSLAMLDAMTLGRPVICHREVAGWLVGDAGILVDSWSADAFASALAQIYGPGWDGRELARAARERASSFNWAASGERYRRLISAVSAHTPAEPHFRLDSEADERAGSSRAV